MHTYMKEKFSLLVECQLINTKKSLKNHPLAIISSGKKHQWAKNDILNHFSYLYIKCLLITKKIKNNFIVE